MMWFLLAVVWVVSGVLTYGIAMASDWEDFPSLRSRREWNVSRGFALGAALLGPTGLVLMCLCTGFAQDGLRYRYPGDD